MPRIRFLAGFAALALLLALSGAALAQNAPETAPQPSAANQTETVVHFFVVPTVLPGARDAAVELPALRQFLAKLAGGYTQLGTGEGGVLTAAGKIETGRSISFLVAAPKDVSKEIAAYLGKHFQPGEQFILTWKANRTG